MARHRRPWSLWFYVTSLRVRRTSTVPPAHRRLPIVAPSWVRRPQADRLAE